MGTPYNPYKPEEGGVGENGCHGYLPKQGRYCNNKPRYGNYCGSCSTLNSRKRRPRKIKLK